MKHQTNGEAERPTVHVLAALNRSYVPIFGVMAQSLFEHRDPARSYEVIVLSLDVTDDDLRAIKVATTPRGDAGGTFDVRVAALDAFSAKIEQASPSPGFTREVFFRLLAPQALPDIHRAVYLDSDLVVLDDVAKIYDEDLRGAVIGACVDPGMAGMVGGYDPDELARLRDVVGMDDPYGYFSAGVLVMDLDAMRHELDGDELLAAAADPRMRYNDQDALNRLCQGGRVHYLDMRWNTLFDSEGVRVRDIVPHAPARIQQAYRAARKNPAIFHYAGPYKPWNRDVDGSELFWEEARRSPCYESVLGRYATSLVSESHKETFDKVWKTFDDLYFKSSEAERIQHDLHLRTSELERRVDELQRQVERLEADNRQLRAEKTPLSARVINRVRAARDDERDKGRD